MYVAENTTIKDKKVVKQAKENKTLLFVLIFVFLAIVGFLSMFFMDVFNFGKKDEIYMTMISNGRANIYKLDVEALEVDPLFEDGSNWGGSFSSDSKRMVFVRSEQESSSQILILEEDGSEFEVGSALNYFVFNPRFSPKGDKIVYWALDSEKPSIFLSDLDGSIEKITEGSSPLFSPDGNNILFVRNDGLYKSDLKTREEIKVFGIDTLSEEFWQDIKISLSSENDVIVTDISSVKKYILSFDNWNSFYVHTAAYLDDAFLTMPRSWTLYSPDGQYFVSVEEMVDKDYMLIFYNTETWEAEMTYGFEDYLSNLGGDSFEGVWITDWILK